jgi:hypothetical protein
MAAVTTQESLRESSPRTHLLQRLWGRVRNGLILQDLLDMLARLGCVIRPYYVVLEAVPEDCELPLPANSLSRRLTGADAAEMARITLRATPVERLAQELEHAFCLGLFVEERLAAYTWASTRAVPVPDSYGTLLFEMGADGAYFFDAYVAPAYRGTRLAGLVRQLIQQHMARSGRRRFYSITMAFNRSSRRFKARLGAQEIELRLYLHFAPRHLRGFDLRLRRWAAALPSPAWTAVVARR